MLYQAYQAHADIMGPVRRLADMAARSVGARLNGSARPTVLSNLTAAYELIARAGLTHVRPPYGIDRVMVGDREVVVTEEAADRALVRTFCNAAARDGPHDAARPRCVHY